MTCPAEAPFDDEVARCLLPEHHLTSTHEGRVATPCGYCRRREAHAEDCPTPREFASSHEGVRWEGPASPMPEPTFDEAVALRRVHALILEQTRRPLTKADMLFDGVIGTFDLAGAFMVRAEEWGRELERETDREEAR